MNDQLMFSSSVVDLAEEQDYLTLKNRICFFNSKNLNNVQIDYDASTLEQCQTLVNMPVVARYVKRDGKDDLGGHEVSVVNGKMKFGTATIGVVTDVEIRNEDIETVTGEVMNLPVLYADERIWTRNENAANAIKRLHLDGKLYSSWEVKTSEYRFENGIKHLSKYSFLSNCLLGTKSYPAYGTSAAKVIDISEQIDDQEYLAAESIFSEALALDVESSSASNINQLDDTNRKEGLSMDVNENVVVETSEEEVKEETVKTVEVEETAEVEAKEEENNEVAEVSEDDPVEESTTEEPEVESAESEDVEGEAEEVSAMKTVGDIRKMIRVALNELANEDYMDVAMIFPEEKLVLVQSWRMKELEYIQYSYRVDGETVVLEDEKKVEMVVSPLQINSEIENKNNAIAEANSRIVELENENAELIKAKEELDKIKAEQTEAEHSEAVNALRDYVVKSGRFTDEEIASEKIQNAINELNESWLKSEIADRLVASLADNKSKKSTGVETSETKDVEKTISIVLSEEKDTATPEDVMNAFFGK